MGVYARVMTPVQTGNRVTQETWRVGLIKLDEPFGKPVDDFKIIQGLAWRVKGLVPPLAPSSTIDDRTFLFVRARCGQEVHLCAYCGGVPAGNAKRAAKAVWFPEGRCFRLPQVNAHQPVQVCKGSSLKVAAGTTHSRVLPPAHEPINVLVFFWYTVWWIRRPGGHVLENSFMGVPEILIGLG
jgi:hypothetical protein